MTPCPHRTTGLSAPGLFVLVPMTAGILAAQALSLPAGRLEAGALGLLAASGLALVLRCRLAALLALAALFIALGAGLERREQKRYREGSQSFEAFRERMETGDAWRLEGVTTSLPLLDAAENSIQATIDVETLWDRDGARDVNWTVQLRLYGADGLERPWRRGSRIRFLARLSPPRGYVDRGVRPAALYFHNRGTLLAASCKSPKLVEFLPDEPTAWTRFQFRVRALAGRLSVVRPVVDLAFRTLEAAVSARAGVREAMDDLYLRIDGLLDREVADTDTRDILKALLLGRDIASADVRDRWVDAGIYHLLVISGFHLTLIAAFLGGVLALFRLPRPAHHLLLIVLLRGYVEFVQAGVSVDRAFWVVTLFLLGRMFYREASLLNGTALAAVLLLAVNPWYLRDAGFLLTFVSVFALALLSSPVEKALTRPLDLASRNLFRPEVDLDEDVDHRRGRRCRFALERIHFRAPRWVGKGGFTAMAGGIAFIWRGLCRAVVPSAAVLALLAPLLAWLHLPVSLQGLVATLPALVLVWPVLILLLCLPLALLVAPASAPLLVHVAARLAEGLQGIAERFSGDPAFLFPPAAWGVALFVALAIWALNGRRRRLWAAVAATVGFALLLARAPAPVPGAFTLTMLDVGEGESILIRTPSGRAVLLDAAGLRPVVRVNGPPVEQTDLARKVLIPHLLARGVPRLDALLLSHSDFDHAGSAISLLRHFPVGGVYVSEAEWKNQPATFAEVFRVCRERNIPLRLLAAPDSGEGAGPERSAGGRGPDASLLVLDGLKLRVLHPAADDGETRSNRLSLVLEADFGGVKALLTGDVDRRVENLLLADGRVGPVHLLKCAHHGSRTSTSGRFLDVAAPRLAVMSTGPFHLFRHPSPEVCEALNARGISWWTTRDRGEIELWFAVGGVFPAFPARWAQEDEAFRWAWGNE
ncbi:MAG: ComEC/Rec2 family competence protein [Acidobacteria bacterium]|nr:ComEC/Rec2 family competence protein [Acidobacteriota bacterium]